MLKQIKLRHVGPAESMDIPFAPHLNILTGDNGLGKTFILDIAWWVLTRKWAGLPAWPDPKKKGRPSIEFKVAAKNIEGMAECIHYNRNRQDWETAKSKPTDKLVLYARADGGISVWDKARCSNSISKSSEDSTGFFNFSSDQIWSGLEEGKKVRCNGLIRDWDTWQYQKEKTFKIFSQVLKALSPESGEEMKPGKSTRLNVDDARSIPTVKLPYGMVPVTHLSSGMRRVLAFAYLLVWAWDEHKEAIQLTNLKPADRLIILFDEVEAHLHPRWQRAFLPALLDVVNLLQQDIDIQIVASTHAPLVLASVEPLFDEDRDRILHVALENGKVSAREIPWAKQGDTVNWLVSDVFGLKQARSREAEQAIEAAETYMRGDLSDLPENLPDRDAIHNELKRVLAGHDPFWPRWIVTTEKESK